MSTTETRPRPASSHPSKCSPGKPPTEEVAPLTKKVGRSRRKKNWRRRSFVRAFLPLVLANEAAATIEACCSNPQCKSMRSASLQCICMHPVECEFEVRRGVVAIFSQSHRTGMGPFGEGTTANQKRTRSRNHSKTIRLKHAFFCARGFEGRGEGGEPHTSLESVAYPLHQTSTVVQMENEVPSLTEAIRRLEALTRRVATRRGWGRIDLPRCQRGPNPRPRCSGPASTRCRRSHRRASTRTPCRRFGGKGRRHSVAGIPGWRLYWEHAGRTKK